ncbi:MAG TPA: PHB depolymerase family esterase [Burkholderiales bacterium]|nr:PHB depolymerase family esterase [Burkholderiales bacterium]
MHPPLPILLAGCLILLSGTAARAELPPGDHDIVIQHAGRSRSYIVHVPLDRLVNPWPVVLNFHGGGSSAAGQQAYTRMDAIADREGFLVVYPNGSGALGNRLLTWNAGDCCGYALNHRIDDVGFVRALVEDLARRTDIDRSRIYATGLSNGAMMAYRLAVDAPDLVAAIAPVAGAYATLPAPHRPAVPVMHIHSIDDKRAIYAGGLGPPYPFTRTLVRHPPVESVVAGWARHDGCSAEPAVEIPLHGRGISEGHTATTLRFLACASGAEVVLVRLTGAGHVWPGGAHEYVSRILGSQSKILGAATDVIDANREIWRFVSAYGRRFETSTPE